LPCATAALSFGQALQGHTIMGAFVKDLRPLDPALGLT